MTELDQTAPAKRNLAAALVDVSERTAATFAQAFLAAVTVGTMTDASALKLGAVAGAYAVGKYLLVEANAYLKRNPGPTL